MKRPRLSERSLPRLHFADGRCKVVLHDVETGECAAISPAEWVLLAAADGTRDLDGVLLAASREGVKASREALEELLAGVDTAGLLDEGPLLRLRSRERDAERTNDARRSRKVERLPGYTFRCDMKGRCCRTYATVVFSPLEAARARALAPNVLDVGERHEHAFMPERGSGPVPGSAIALVDGGCAFLDGTLCSLHRAGGPGAKPAGCNIFPLSLVDDGVRVRAAVTVECACVLSSVGVEGGDPLVGASVERREDLDAALAVDDLPAELDLTASRRVSLAEFVAWSDAALGALAATPSLTAAEDTPAVAWALAEAIDRSGDAALDAEKARAAVSAPPAVDIDRVMDHIAALGDRAARLTAQNAWRSSRDLVRRGLSAVTASAQILRDRDVLDAVVLQPASDAVTRDEAFYLRAVLFGHQLVGQPIAGGLRNRAVAMWIARVVPLAAALLELEGEEPGFEHPIAIVEALLRGYGLRL